MQQDFLCADIYVQEYSATVGHPARIIVRTYVDNVQPDFFLFQQLKEENSPGFLPSDAMVQIQPIAYSQHQVPDY